MPSIKNLWVFNENKLYILKSLYVCSREDKVCGCDLVENLSLSKNLVSYHVKTLREGGLVEEIRQGRNCHYKITKKKMPEVKKILEVTGLI